MNRTGSSEPTAWAACLADAHKGIAFFDGIRIDTDRITDPRWDRVLPIFEEEQIFMCRMLRERGILTDAKGRQHLRVLDVGTGSGVFAIFAAAHGCHVTAVDISPRAIRFTEHNLTHTTNRLSIEHSGGRVTPVLADITDPKAKLAQQSFDIIFLSPPYNPTAKGLAPALHASAGPLGQDRFNEQLKAVWSLLKPGGVLVGNHMAFHEAEGSESWLRGILSRGLPPENRSRAFGLLVPILLGSRRGRSNSSPALEGTIKAEDFLHGQYSAFLESDLTLKPSGEEIKQYIQEALGKRPERKVFGLYYFELKEVQAPVSRKAHGPKVECCSLEKLHLQHLRPPRDWDHRIILHRAIVEHTSPLSSFPSPALFLANDFCPALPDPEPPSHAQYVGLETPEDRIERSILKSIAKWIVQTRLIGPEGDGFDFALIDVGPWFETWEGRDRLQQEAILCARRTKPRVDLKTLLRHYQRNTKCMQELRLAPFLHPHFTGQNAPHDWRGIQYNVISAKNEIRFCLSADEATRMTEWLARLKAEFRGQRKLEGREKIEFNTSRAKNRKLANLDLAFSSLPFKRLKVPSVAAYEEEMRKRCGTDDESVRRDLEIIHFTFHQRLRQLFSKEFSGTRRSEKENWTTALVGIPLALAFSSGRRDSGRLPESFRGGLWIFAGTRNRMTPHLESLLLDLSRLATLLAESFVTAQATAENSDSLRQAYESTIGHELKPFINDINTLTPAWALRDLRRYLRIFATTSTALDEVHWKETWELLTKDFGDLYNGNTLREFVINHYKFAKAMEETRHRLRTENETFRCANLKINFRDQQIAPHYQPNSDSKSASHLKKTFYFSLALMAAFRNAIRNGHSLYPISCVFTGDSINLVNRRADLHAGGAPGNYTGTQGVLRRCASEYRPAHDIPVVFEPRHKNYNDWETNLPVPEAFVGS